MEDTPDIQLRPPTWPEMAFVRWLWNDPQTMAPVGGTFPMTDEQARRWFEKMVDPGSATDCYRLIFDPAARPVGEISFHRLDPETMTAELNVKVAAAERGKGCGRAALILFLDDFFREAGGRVMIDDVALDNLRGQKVMQRFGFEHDPAVPDVMRLRMTRERFEELHGHR